MYAAHASSQIYRVYCELPRQSFSSFLKRLDQKIPYYMASPCNTEKIESGKRTQEIKRNPASSYYTRLTRAGSEIRTRGILITSEVL